MYLQVLQHLMEGLVSFTFKPEDLQCSFFRYVARELLACAVMRPVLNLASPRYLLSSSVFIAICVLQMLLSFLYYYVLMAGLLMKELKL